MHFKKIEYTFRYFQRFLEIFTLEEVFSFRIGIFQSNGCKWKFIKSYREPDGLKHRWKINRNEISRKRMLIDRELFSPFIFSLFGKYFTCWGGRRTCVADPVQQTQQLQTVPAAWFCAGQDTQYVSHAWTYCSWSWYFNVAEEFVERNAQVCWGVIGDVGSG